MRNGLAALETHDVAGYFQHGDARMGGRCHVRADPDIGMSPERVALGQRLDAEDVEDGAAELAAVDSSNQVGIDDMAAARTVDEKAASGLGVEQVGTDDVFRLCRQGKRLTRISAPVTAATRLSLPAKDCAPSIARPLRSRRVS